MAYYTRPQGLKTNGKPKSLQVTDDGYLKIDMQDATVVAEFTPGSNVTLLDSAGTNEASIDSSGALKVVEKTPLTGFATSANQIKTVTTTTLIDNATFTATATGADIDLSNSRNGIITVSVGTVTTGSITVKLQMKDSNGNYIDYLTLTALSVSNTTTYEEFFDIAFSTGRLVATSASANIANVTVELQKTA